MFIFSRKIYSTCLILLISLYCLSTYAAKIDYKAAADDISQRLDTALSQYQSGDVKQAKRVVQMAYFRVFENLEGPVRINYSAQYSRELEGKFGEIRKLIANGKPVSEVTKQINWLKNEINSLPVKLEAGHQLIAEKNDFNATTIATEWQHIANETNNAINETLYAYRDNDQTLALKNIQTAFLDYKSSGLSDVLIENKKTSDNTDIISYFENIIAQVKLNPQDATRDKQVRDIAYQGYMLTEKLNDILPGLPGKKANKKTLQKDWVEINSTILNAVDAAIAKYQSGDIDVGITDVQDTYFDVFEASGYENTLGAHDSTFKAKLESYFTRIVSLMTAKHDVIDINLQRDLLERDLIKAAGMLDNGPQSFWEVAIQAFIILLREGLEAMLIVAAIAAYLIKNNHQEKMWVVKQSVGLALVASVITAYIFKLLFTNSGVNREILEGATMAVAVVILFFMSYWLLSKVEAHQWQKYLQNKLKGSLTKGSIMGLWLASFLAVYREGAETVLFYFALSAGVNNGGLTGIAAGVIAALVALFVIYLIMRYTVVKLPLKPFFIFTGSFMYLMAFIFSGKSVMELVEGKVIQPTILSHMPEISWLGVYPYVESLIPQLVLVVAAILAWLVIKLRAKKS